MPAALWQWLKNKLSAASCRASAAVDVVTRETSVRAGELASGPNKRRRTSAPEEGCPYCSHTYTVRDGLSTKMDDDGERCAL
jgi:hypothetical protein